MFHTIVKKVLIPFVLIVFLLHNIGYGQKKDGQKILLHYKKTNFKSVIVKKKNSLYIKPEFRKGIKQINFYYKRADSILVLYNGCIIHSLRLNVDEDSYGVVSSFTYHFQKDKGKIYVLLVKKGEYIIIPLKKRFYSITIRPSLESNIPWYVSYSNNLPSE